MKNNEISDTRLTIDKVIRGTSIFSVVDFVITPVISQILTGEYKPLHEYLGLPPEMSETQIKAGAAYWD